MSMGAVRAADLRDQPDKQLRAPIVTTPWKEYTKPRKPPNDGIVGQSATKHYTNLVVFTNLAQCRISKGCRIP
jgi:hypothetical protein